LVDAYSVFPNEGEYVPCGFIKEIKIDGHSVYQKPQCKTRVFSKETSYLTTNMLQSAATNGTAKKLRPLPFDIAAKTGTVGSANGNTDAYALSYTTNDIVGVWLGNADNSIVSYTGGGLPCQYLYQINQALHERYQNKNQTIPAFSPPEGVVNVSIDKILYQNEHTLAIADEIAPAGYKFNEIFRKTNVPTFIANHFSSPSITMPTIRFKNDNVQITFDELSPDFYEYVIERDDGQKKRVVYVGKRLDAYTDDSVEKNKRYVYTVTPKYKNHTGTSVILPAISTTQTDKKILDNHWWIN